MLFFELFKNPLVKYEETSWSNITHRLIDFVNSVTFTLCILGLYLMIRRAGEVLE